MHMENFKIGDDVWFFFTEFGQNRWYEEITIIYPQKVEFKTGKIINANANDDYVHVYVDGDQKLLCFGFTFFDTYVFKTKQEAINKMIESMQKLLMNELFC